MATLALSNAGRIEVVEWGEQVTLVAAADITAGTFVRQDSNGKAVLATADTATNVAGARLALRTVKAGEAVTAMKTGLVSGYVVPQAFNSALFIANDGTLADAAGTTSVQVGRVTPGTANLVNTSHDKLVRIHCPN